MRRRILLLVVGMTVLVVLAFAVPLTVLIRNNAYDDGIEGLRRETVDISFSYLRGENRTPSATQIRTYLDSLGTRRSASVQLPSGQVVGTLPPGGFGQLPDPPERSSGPGGRPGSADGPGGQQPTIAYGGGQLTQVQVPVFSGGDFQSSTYIVRVWASDETLRSGQTTPLLLLGGASLGLLLLGVVLGEVLTRRIVRPLVETSETAQRLATGDTLARAPVNGPPEVADVGRALNRLADRIDQLIAEERETVADLSHRLRTPMTAMRLDAEVLRDAADAERMGTHVTTLERMLTAVIRAARRPEREGRLPSSDASAVVGGRVEFWSALAEDQRRTVTATLPNEPLLVSAGAEDLAAAVDALLENVIAHTPEGTAFTVTLTPASPGGVLEITDDGPGLPADASVRGRSDRGSSGLGLDIARRCAESSGGSMELGEGPGGGARVTLRLGAVASFGPAQDVLTIP